MAFQVTGQPVEHRLDRVLVDRPILGGSANSTPNSTPNSTEECTSEPIAGKQAVHIATYYPAVRGDHPFVASGHLEEGPWSRSGAPGLANVHLVPANRVTGETTASGNRLDRLGPPQTGGDGQ